MGLWRKENLPSLGRTLRLIFLFFLLAALGLIIRQERTAKKESKNRFLYFSPEARADSLPSGPEDSGGCSACDSCESSC